MFKVKVLKERCKGCKLCIEVCPKNIFSLSENFNKLGLHYVVADKDKNCIGCKKCVIICPDIAIEIYKMEGKNENRSNS